MSPDARLDDETEQGIEDRTRCYSFRALTIEAAEVAQREAIDAYRRSLVAKVEALMWTDDPNLGASGIAHNGAILQVLELFEVKP